MSKPFLKQEKKSQLTRIFPIEIEAVEFVLFNECDGRIDELSPRLCLVNEFAERTRTHVPSCNLYFLFIYIQSNQISN